MRDFVPGCASMRVCVREREREREREEERVKEKRERRERGAFLACSVTHQKGISVVRERMSTLEGERLSLRI